MTTILAIESSTPHASLALWRDGEIVWDSAFTSDRAHNSHIFEPLEAGLETCGRAIDLVVVGIGPGSYGGVRVGIAVANGLALALGSKTIGWSSLESMSGEPDFAVIGDARRKSFFLARIRNGKQEEEPALLTEQGLIDDLTLLNRKGVPLFTSDPALAESHAAVVLVWPSAVHLAQIAAELTPEEIAALESKPLEPHYLRAPYITTPKQSGSSSTT